MIEITPIIKMSELIKEIEKMPLDKAWNNYLQLSKSMQWFWIKAIEINAQNTNLKEERKTKYLKSANSAFDFMDKWRKNEITLVRARVNEIDSAISYIRNSALDLRCSFYYSPISRNVASILRMCLRIGEHGYYDEQIPSLIASAIHYYAAVACCLPYDIDDLFTAYLPSNMPMEQYDRWHIFMQIAANKIGFIEILEAIYKKVNRLWEHFDNPEKLLLPDYIWTKKESYSRELYKANYSNFHS